MPGITPTQPRRKLAIAEGLDGKWHWLAGFFDAPKPIAVGRENTALLACKAATSALNDELHHLAHKGTT